LDKLQTIVDTVCEELEAKNAVRDQTLRRSRELIRHCANSIRATHRDEFADAQALLSTARAAAAEMVADIRQYPDLYYAGYTQDPASTDGINEYRYYLRWSADGGATWSDPAMASQGIDASVNVIEPRLLRTPGTRNSGKLEDIRNAEIFVLAWGTEVIPPDASERIGGRPCGP